MKVAVCGPRGYGSWRARGGGLANAHGWEILDCRKPIPRDYDTIWVVKRRLGLPLPANLRDRCGRLIFDPLDFWASPSSADPYSCWLRLWNQFRFDDLIATSPASQEAMQHGLKGSAVQVHLLPHQCDGRIEPDWYDENGPLVYAGSRCFIGKYQNTLEEAARRLGRAIRFDYSQHHAWRSLKGAALQLCLRFPPHNCRWNRLHRPQIKLENSAAGGIPLLYNGHECEVSLHDGHPSVDLSQHREPQHLAHLFEQALQSRPPETCYRPEDFYRDAAEMVQT